MYNLNTLEIYLRHILTIIILQNCMRIERAHTESANNDSHNSLGQWIRKHCSAENKFCFSFSLWLEGKG